MKHVHAEVIKAWADNPAIGIQYRDGGPWEDIKTKDICWDSECEYRIKPAFPETTMTHEQLEHAYNAAPNRWELKLTEFANAVLAHAVETGQLVVPDEQTKKERSSVWVPATKTKCGLIPTRELDIAKAVRSEVAGRMVRAGYDDLVVLEVVSTELEPIIASVKS